jgi:hypothetical protein
VFAGQEGEFVGRFSVIVGLVLTSLSHAGWAEDQKTYTFRERYDEGQSFNCLYSISLNMSFERSYRGTVIDRARLVDAAQQKGVVTILETADGTPILQRIAVDKSSGEFYQFSGETPSQDRVKLAGKTVDVTRQPGDFTTFRVNGNYDPRTQDEILMWLGRDDDLYPNHPVRLREKWDIRRAMGHQRILSDDQQTIAYAKLAAVRMIHGRPFAQLVVSMAVVGSLKKAKNIHMEMQVEGTAMVDLESGRVARMDLAGDIGGSGPIQVAIPGRGATTINSVGTGKIEIHQISVAVQPRTVTAAAK